MIGSATEIGQTPLFFLAILLDLRSFLAAFGRLRILPYPPFRLRKKMEDRLEDRRIFAYTTPAQWQQPTQD